MIIFRVTGIDLLITVLQKKNKACRENRIILFKEHEEKNMDEEPYHKTLQRKVEEAKFISNNCPRSISVRIVFVTVSTPKLKCKFLSMKTEILFLFPWKKRSVALFLEALQKWSLQRMHTGSLEQRQVPVSLQCLSPCKLSNASGSLCMNGTQCHCLWVSR